MFTSRPPTALGMTSLTLRAALLAGTAFALTVPAQAQDVSPPPAQAQATTQAPQAAPDDLGEEDDIVVVGQRPRGSVVGDIPPENTLTGRDVRRRQFCVNGSVPWPMNAGGSAIVGSSSCFGAKESRRVSIASTGSIGKKGWACASARAANGPLASGLPSWLGPGPMPAGLCA